MHVCLRLACVSFKNRWLNGALSRQSNLDCTLLAKQPEMLAANGVIEFLIGQPLGQRCLAQVLDVRCGKDGQNVSDVVTLFDAGLPIGAARKQALADAHAVESTTKHKNCVMSALKSLDGTLSSP